MTNWQGAIADIDLPPDGKVVVPLDGWHVLIARTDAGLVAVNDRCPHAASPLSTGRIRRGFVMCPLHGARFDLATRECAGGVYPPLRGFDVRVAEGMIEVAVPDHAPSMADLPITL